MSGLLQHGINKGDEGEMPEVMSSTPVPPALPAADRGARTVLTVGFEFSDGPMPVWTDGGPPG
jgi:hypothetical protein